ncbi:L-arabinolactonase [alpha proteobacterium Q-1]|nr:L-arabinolactonase [alpha proteobacterium Q-1]
MWRHGIVMLAEAYGRIACGCTLGEGIQWHEPSQTLWWTDIEKARLWRAKPDFPALERNPGAVIEATAIPLPERLCSFAFTKEPDVIAAAFASGLAFYHLEHRTIDWIARPELGKTGRRFNDGRADRAGRFWVGSMVEDEGIAGAASASLYCLDLDARLHLRQGGIAISNGLCFSPDGKKAYFADSPTRRIVVSDYDGKSGDRRAQRLFAQTPDGAFPDGAAIDAKGGLWSAFWGAGLVRHFAPDGRLMDDLSLPVPQPSCVCFAGPDLDYLCITTARAGLSAEALAMAPQSGDVFIYKIKQAGLPENRYEGLIPGKRSF